MVEEGLEICVASDSKFLFCRLPSDRSDSVFVNDICVALGDLSHWSCHILCLFDNALFEHKYIISTNYISANGGCGLLTQKAP